MWHVRRHGFIDRNPISLVRQSAKRQTVPDVLLPSEINRLLQGLHNRERTLVLLAAGTGLRMCELFGRKWRNIDFAEKQASVLVLCGVAIVAQCNQIVFCVMSRMTPKLLVMDFEILG
jgi:integrase